MFILSNTVHLTHLIKIKYRSSSQNRVYFCPHFYQNFLTLLIRTQIKTLIRSVQQPIQDFEKTFWTDLINFWKSDPHQKPNWSDFWSELWSELWSRLLIKTFDQDFWSRLWSNQFMNSLSKIINNWIVNKDSNRTYSSNYWRHFSQRTENKNKQSNRFHQIFETGLLIRTLINTFDLTF